MNPFCKALRKKMFGLGFDFLNLLQATWSPSWSVGTKWLHLKLHQLEFRIDLPNNKFQTMHKWHKKCPATKQFSWLCYYLPLFKTLLHLHCFVTRHLIARRTSWRSGRWARPLRTAAPRTSRCWVEPGQKNVRPLAAFGPKSVLAWLQKNVAKWLQNSFGIWFWEKSWSQQNCLQQRLQGRQMGALLDHALQSALRLGKMGKTAAARVSQPGGL